LPIVYADFREQLKILASIIGLRIIMITKSLFSFEDEEIYSILEPEIRDWFRKKFRK